MGLRRVLCVAGNLVIIAVVLALVWAALSIAGIYLEGFVEAAGIR